MSSPGSNSPRQGRRGRPSRVPEIVRNLRQYVHQHRLQPTDQLPPEPELAALMNVSCMTLRKALDQLAGEGFLERRHGIGTFLLNPAKLTVGVLIHEDVLYAQTSFFIRCVVQEIQDHCQSVGLEARLLPVKENGTLYAADLLALRDQEIDGALIFNKSQGTDALARLQALSLPLVNVISHAGQPIAPYAVGHQLNCVAAISAIMDVGIQDIGLVGWHFRRHRNDCENARKAARELKANLPDKWIITAPRHGLDSARRGRQLGQQWLAMNHRPRGLIFADHFEVQGFLYELLAPAQQAPFMPVIAVEEAIETPLDLPWPVIRLHFQITPIVHEAISCLKQLLAGTPPDQHEYILNDGFEVHIPPDLADTLNTKLILQPIAP